MRAGGWLVAVVAALAAGGAASQECASPMDQATMTGCALADWQAADAQLNAVWKRAMAAARAMDEQAPPGRIGTAEALLRAQRSWITFRDQACLAEGLVMRGGSAQPMLEYGCKARLTRARTEDLRLFADMY